MARESLAPRQFGAVTISAPTQRGIMASVYYRTPGNELKRLRSTAPTEHEARMKLSAKIAQTRALFDSQPIVLDALEDYLTENSTVRRRHKDQTTTAYRRIINHHITPHPIATMLARDVSPATAQEFIDHIARNTQSQARIARLLLHGAFARLERTGIIDRNPISPTRTPAAPRTEPRILPFDDISTFRLRLREWYDTPRLGPAKPEYLIDLVDLLLLTGMRIGEALSLMWSDIELPAGDMPLIPAHAPDGVRARPIPGDRGAVTIQSTLLAEAQGSSLRQDAPKTSASFRRIVIPPTATEILLRRYRLTIRAFDGTSPWVFPNRDGDQPVRMSTVNRNWRDARAFTGFTDLTFHDFRRTHATFLDQAGNRTGTGLEIARRVLGHSSSAITERHYRARTAQSVPDVSDIMEGILHIPDITGEIEHSRADDTPADDS